MAVPSRRSPPASKRDLYQPIWLGIVLLGAGLVIYWVIREASTGDAEVPLAPLVVGTLMLLTTIPTAFIKKIGVGRSGLILEFHPPDRSKR